MSVSVRVRRLPPETESKITQLFKNHREDFNWILDNMETLIDQYPNMYIAVKKLEVTDADKKINELERRIIQSGKSLSDHTIEFIHPGETKYLF